MNNPIYNLHRIFGVARARALPKPQSKASAIIDRVFSIASRGLFARQNRRCHLVTIGVVGDIKDTVAALLPLVPERSDSAFLNRHVGIHRRAEEKLNAKLSRGHAKKISGVYLTKVIALVGDGAFSMMMGELLTTVQEKPPVKICVYDNAKLGFVEIEQKTEGLLPTFTDNLNPDFGAIAQATGLWGKTISDPEDVEWNW